MSIVNELTLLAEKNHFKSEAAFDLMKGIQGKSEAEQIAIAKALAADTSLMTTEGADYLRGVVSQMEASQAEIPTAKDYLQDDGLKAKAETEKPQEKTLLEALLPRTYENINKGDLSTSGAILAGGLDALSGIGRAGVAGAKALTGNLEGSFYDEMAKQEGGGFFEQMARSPLTMATIATGGLGGSLAARGLAAARTAAARSAQAEAGAAAGGLARALSADGLGARMAQGAVGGAAGGLVGTAPVVAAQEARGEITPSEAAQQVAFGTVGGGLIGGALPAAGAGLRKVFNRPEVKPEMTRTPLYLPEDVAAAQYRPLAELAPPSRGALPATTDAAESAASRGGAGQSYTFEAFVDPEKMATKAVGGGAEGRKEMVNKIVSDYTGIPVKQVEENLPQYMKTHVANMTEADRETLKRYFDLEFRSRMAGRAEDLTSALQYASQDLNTGVRAMKNARSAAGGRMGELEDAASASQIDKIDLLGTWKGAFEKRGVTIANDDAGNIVVRPLESGSKISDPDIADLQKMVDAVIKANGNSRMLTAEQMRNMEQALKSEMGRNMNANTTRQGVIKTDADVVMDDAFAALAKGRRENIKRTLGDEAASEYDKARQAYAKISGDMDYFQRRLGREIKNETPVPWSDDLEQMITSARGPNMLTRLFEGVSDNQSVGLVQAIKQLTGVDVLKNASLAKYAGEVAESARSGRFHAPASKAKLTPLGALKKAVTPKPKSMEHTLDLIVKNPKAEARRAGMARQAAGASLGAMTMEEAFMRPMLLNSRKK